MGQAAVLARAAQDQRVIQVDLDEQMLGLNKPIDVGVVADVRVFLAALLGELTERDLSHRAVSRESKLREYAGGATGSPGSRSTRGPRRGGDADALRRTSRPSARRCSTTTRCW